MKQDMIGFAGTSYEPLLERHIGSKIVLEMHKKSGKLEIVGMLKDYTANYIELMDVDYTPLLDGPSKKADIIIPRDCGFVRHSSE